MLGWQLARSAESNCDSGHSSDAQSGSDADPLEAIMAKYARATLQQSMSDAEASDADNDAYCQLQAPPMREEDSGTDVSEFDLENLVTMPDDAESLDTLAANLL